MSNDLARSVAITAVIVASLLPDAGQTQDFGTRFVNFLFEAKEARENPLSVVQTPGVGIRGVGSVGRAAGPPLAVGSAALNAHGMVSDYIDISNYAEKRRAGTATMEDAYNAGGTFQSFAEGAGVDGGPAVKRIVGAAAGGVLQVDRAGVCNPWPQCAGSVLNELEQNRERYLNAQVEEYSSKNLIMKGAPATVANAVNLTEGAIDAGTSITDRIAPAVDRAAAAVSSRAAAVGDWLRGNSPADVNDVNGAPNIGGIQKPSASVPMPQPQVQTQPAPQAAPTPAPAATPVVTSNAPQQIVVPRQKATVTPRQVPTATQMAPAATPAPAQPQASTQPITPPAPRSDSPWQQQQRADAAAAAAIAAERPAGLSQGQPAIGGIQSDKIWYDGSQGFGGLYELDPKEKAQQAIGYTEANYPDAVSVDGQPFGVEPKPDPFGDLVPDAADAIEPEQPVQNRDVPPEPIEQASSEGEDFDSMSSNTDPYTAPQRQNTNRDYGNQPTQRRRVCDGSPQYDTRNPVPCY